MITLNTEKGLVKVEDWGEIIERAGFKESLDPSEHELKEIIGRYDFKDKIRCGLSTCHSPHNKGYLVTTIDGHETNIGRICGSKFFGADFEERTRQFDRLITEQENRFIIKEFDINSPIQRIHDLRTQEKGVDWVYHKICFLTQRTKAPSNIADHLAGMIKNRNSKLTVLFEASDAEVEAIESVENVRLSRPHYVERTVADLSGFEVLYPENDLRELVIIELESNLNTLSSLDVDSLSYTELQYWSKFVGNVEPSIKKVVDILESGRVFLQRDNLIPLKKLGYANYDDIDNFNDFIKTL